MQSNFYELTKLTSRLNYNNFILLLKYALIILVIIIIIGVIKDRYYYKNKKYKVKYKTRKTRVAASDSEFYVKYWFWERKKRQFYYNLFSSNDLIPYTQHARSNKYSVKTNTYLRSHIPFREEVSCKAK